MAKLPYQWEYDLMKNSSGTNIHDILGFRGILRMRLSSIERSKAKGDKEEYMERVRKLNKNLKDGWKNGFLAHIYTFSDYMLE